MNLLHTAIQASLKAGKEIMEVYASNFEVETKADDSPLTVADKRANALILSYLKETNIPIISEETKQTDFSQRRQWQQCWIVDPLDGTKEFIKRNGEFTVNIALIENGQPILGVIYVPDCKTLYFAEVNTQKAFKAQLESHDATLDEIFDRVSEIAPKKDSNKARVVGSRSHLNEQTQKYIDTLSEKEEVEIVSKGSSLKFCLVAEGKADRYPRFAPTMEWDTAAGHAICNAVGVTVMALPENKPLQYNKENLLNPWFLVSNQN
ncbi:3'(2'),5'-bisphosphate nucleotidase CysQ [Marixanthomonas spongiae]|uniref:3'(2'),5'-bisphosphate nucleotidase CysQ n=1 Tax=Marixanthomonas spongiae TaxID=2174845 RepID=A0A2U0I3V0_9FLAO|nr:3'(2'),5'-bisphosphate nucleotidase CysQ [Marixanthomonas spongiae]PVW15769.1 3'(2'),5'-bisphosphate nucleotidase [Marixanthomonas spongiae]